MLKQYLDDYIISSIEKSFSLDDITELRFRIGKPVIIVTGNKKYFLKSNNNFIIAERTLIDKIVGKISDNSLYAINDQLINGYITLDGGIRVGLAGNVVKEDAKVITIKEFTSINFRLPHEIKNCSLNAFEYIFEPNINNTLIISPPGAGKTTYLRDIVQQIDAHSIPINVLLVDERNEISSVVKGDATQDMGRFCDIYTNCDKGYAFKNGIRSMNPDLIVTDEIDIDKDIDSIIDATNSGVKVIATIHAGSIEELKRKKSFQQIIEGKLFSRYIVLSKSNGPGTLDYIYDEKFNSLYCRAI